MPDSRVREEGEELGERELWAEGRTSGSETRCGLPMGPTPTRDVKTRTQRSVGTCDRLQRPRRLPCPKSVRSAAGCRPRAPSWVGGARAEAEPEPS